MSHEAVEGTPRVSTSRSSPTARTDVWHLEEIAEDRLHDIELVRRRAAALAR